MDILDWLRRVRRVLDNMEEDPFKIPQMSRTIVLDVVESFTNHRGKSLKEIASEHTLGRRQYENLLYHLVDFEDMIRTHVREQAPPGSDFIRNTITDEDDYLIIEFERPRNQNEIGFEEYLEQARADGDVIHPEIDKQLRFFRSTGAGRGRVPVSLFYRGRF